MFENCKALQEFSLTLTSSLSWQCYGYMLLNCKKLQIAPCFPNLRIAKEAIINQQMLEGCPIQTININNKLYDINVLKLL